MSMKNQHHTKESIEKMKFIHRKKNLSDKTLEKLRLASLGENNSMYGKHHSQKTKEKMSLVHSRENLNNEILNKMSESARGENNHFYGKHYYGEDNPFYGKHHTEETKQKIRFTHLGENNPNWIDGRSFEPYSFEFNRQLKELIRRRDGYKCQLCGMPEIENIEKLSIHHIDYNKENNLPDNLITLCKSCNTKVNFNRDSWEEYFEEIILEKLTKE